MRDLEGKVAVITGGGSGMGRAFADRCMREGMRIVLADVEEEALSKAEIELEDMGDTVVETGDATLVLQNDDGTTDVAAKYIIVWKRQSDGAWKLHNDCFNFDAPMG